MLRRIVPPAVLMIEILLAPSGLAQSPSPNSAMVELEWSAPLTGGSAKVGEMSVPGTGLFLGAGASDVDGRVSIVGTNMAPKSQSPILLWDAEKGPGVAQPLKLNGVAEPGIFSLIIRIFGFGGPPKSPVVNTLIPGRGGHVFVGGFDNEYYDIGSTEHSDAYVGGVSF